jgi:hypothetical protein
MVFAAVSVVLAIALFWNHRQVEPQLQPGPQTATAPTTQELPASPVSADGASAVPGNVSAPATAIVPVDIQTEIETVKFFIRDYRAAFDETPVGDNAEITKALMGANPKKTKFVQPGDSHLNEKSELVDPWGTPYFFHATSGKEMEVHCAGPDRRMWTGDDIVMR